MDAFTKFIVVIIFKCICVSNHHIAEPKLLQHDMPCYLNKPRKKSSEEKSVVIHDTTNKQGTMKNSINLIKVSSMIL